MTVTGAYKRYRVQAPEQTDTRLTPPLSLTLLSVTGSARPSMLAYLLAKMKETKMTLQTMMWFMFCLAIALAGTAFFIDLIILSAALAVTGIGIFLGICRFGIALGGGPIMIVDKTS